MIDRRDVADVLAVFARLEPYDRDRLLSGDTGRLTDKLLDAIVAGVAAWRATPRHPHSVVELWRVPDPTGAPVREQELQVERSGIVGDYHRDGTVTLVEFAAVERAGMIEGSHRRNVVVAPGPLPEPPVIAAFPGGPRLVAYERAEPCQRLAELAGRLAPPREMVGSGLRCRVLSAGVIDAHDRIEWSNPE